MTGEAPRLRFQEFDSPWSSAVAGDLFASRREAGDSSLPIYSVTQDRGLVRRDSLDRNIGSDAADKDNLRVCPGDIVYNTMRMWQGAVGIASHNCMVSPAYVVLKPRSGTVSELFAHWFKTPTMLQRLEAYSHGLTRDRLRLYFDDFAQIPLRVPMAAEQRKIAAFLGAVDSKIDALRRKKAALTRFKAGLAQKMFSQELRFRRDDGTNFPDWAEVRVGDVITRVVDAYDPRKDFDTPTLIELENIEGGSGHLTGHTVVEDQISIKHRFAPGDVLYGKLRPYLRKFARPDFAGVCSSEIWVLRNRPIQGGELRQDYLYVLIQSETFQSAAEQSSGSKMPRADWHHISEVVIELPHPDEQRKIANALSALDAKISTACAKIAQMETFKKGLLQQMFV